MEIFPIVLPLLKSSSLQGQEGETVGSGCIIQTCKSGVWRPSLDKTVCCFNGEPFQFGSRITTINSSDNCTTTTLECEEDGIKTRIDQNRGKAGCSGPASKKEIREMKCMLKEHMEKSGKFQFKLTAMPAISY